MSNVISAFKAFAADEGGVTAIEYGLIAALVGVAVAATAKTLGGDLSAVFGNVSGKLKDAIK
ncbi:Flp family type IVb pilin [Massilia forsythiae]|uniref:Flp family type IVb pilin n=1 Tax=Massilia forsythiae TaxID=2728020 RepID=A0A7Z2VUU2_9BURK|nr:Flp family type IVb pilin [Massilia forsythiae]QJD99865.1 Flp family type IVb pilin [Massilia forsythiae]